MTDASTKLASRTTMAHDLPRIVEALVASSGVSDSTARKLAQAAERMRTVWGKVVMVGTTDTYRYVTVGKPHDVGSYVWFNFPPKSAVGQHEAELVRAQSAGLDVTVFYESTSQQTTKIHSVTVLAPAIL